MLGELLRKRTVLLYTYVFRHPGYNALRRLVVINGYTALMVTSVLVERGRRYCPIFDKAERGLIQNKRKRFYCHE
jgi:hypothetical protein